MKKIGYIIIALGGLTFAFYLYEQYNLVKKFSYKITGSSVKSASMSSVVITVGFSITNLSDFSAHLTNVDLKGYFNNILSGYITNDLDIIIPAKGTGQVQVDLTILPAQITPNLLNILTTITGGNNLNLNLTGTITVKTQFFPLKLPVSFSTSGKELVSLYNQK